MRLRGDRDFVVTTSVVMYRLQSVKNLNMRKYFLWFAALAFLLGLLSVNQVSAQDETPTPEVDIPTSQAQAPTPSQVIEAINQLRMSHGIAPLSVHPILMQVGQQEAEGIAGGMGGHWRPNELTLGQWLLSLGYPLLGDLSLDGYRSENWGFAGNTEEAIAMWLGDDEHTNTMLSLDRSDIGVGIAFSEEDSSYVIVVETALQTKSGQMQWDAIPILTGIPQTQAAYSAMSTEAARNGLLPQGMAPVALNTALADGNVYHDVKYGQTLWSIAITYRTTIKQIQQLNNLTDTTVQPGQHLLILKGATQPAPREASITPMTVQSPHPLSTPTMIRATKTLAPESTPFFAQDKPIDRFSIIAIGAAALFLGGLFTVMTKKKPI
jgi:LysM repeat protein